MARVACPKCGFSAEDMALCPKCGTATGRNQQNADTRAQHPLGAQSGSIKDVATRSNDVPQITNRHFRASSSVGAFVAGAGWVTIAMAVIVVIAFTRLNLGLAIGVGGGLAIGGLLLVIMGQQLQITVGIYNCIREIRDLAQRQS